MKEIEQDDHYKEIQNKFFDILDNGIKEEGDIPKFEIESKIFVTKEDHNWNYDFLEFIEPKLRNAKILDLFCGRNKGKDFFKNKGVNTELTGVDLQETEADIIADVAEIDRYIKPEKQFSAIFNFGGIPQTINFEVIQNYLKDDGFYVSSMSDYLYDNKFVPLLERKIKIDGDSWVKEFSREFDYFIPIVAMEVKNIFSFASEESKKIGEDVKKDSVYIIFKKKH
jgi:hypothetical protein